MSRRTLAVTALALASMTAPAAAQKAITGARTTIDFTGYTAAGLQSTPAAGQLDSDEWLPLGFSNDTPPISTTTMFGTQTWGATLTTADTDFTRGPSVGGETTGGLFAFAVGVSDPAFGWQPGGADATPGKFTLRLINNTGAPIVDPKVSYEAWVFNDQGRANSITFAHSADDVTYTDVAALDLVSTAVADSPAAWVKTDKSIVLTGVTIADGALYYLQWKTNDVSGSGNRDEFAIDDIVIQLPGCGDGVFQGAEACDDGDNTSGDGCSATCTVETGYDCGTAFPSVCTATCGDGVTAIGAETCDDIVGTPVSSDGCSATCQEENGYDCTTASPSVCTAICGDHIVAGAETCDDNDVTPTSGDGCSDTCTLETGFNCSPGVACTAICGDGLELGAETCDDGDAIGGDGCSNVCTTEVGWMCPTPGSDCTATCGDGLIAIGAETCDDSDAMDGDGCSASCAPEAGWTCAGTPSVCTTTCGDGIVVGTEECDDDEVQVGDGCSGSCTVEHGYECSGMPSTCASDCGDGEIASNEECDDSGTTAGDGCDEGCGFETGYTCTGEPSVCVEDTLCGNGALDGAEECDDGAREDGDGCSNGCTVELGYVCDGEPSTCEEDGDGDGVPDADDNCPDVANPQQPDDDDDGQGNACDDDTAVPGPEGCCAVGQGTDERAGWLLLGAFVMLGLKRPSRRKRA